MGPMPTPAQTTVTGSPGHGQLARENFYTKQCTERRFMEAQVVRRPERAVSARKRPYVKNTGYSSARPIPHITAPPPGRKMPGTKQRVVPTTPDPTVAQTSFSQSTSRREPGVVIKGHDAAAFPGCGGSLVI